MNHSACCPSLQQNSRCSANERLRGQRSFQLTLFHRFANGQIKPLAGRFSRVFFRINERKHNPPPVCVLLLTLHDTLDPPPPRFLTLVLVGEAPLPDGVAGGEPLLGDGAVSGDGHGQDPGVGGHTARGRLAAVPTDVGAHWRGGGDNNKELIIVVDIKEKLTWSLMTVVSD